MLFVERGIPPFSCLALPLLGSLLIGAASTVVSRHSSQRRLDQLGHHVDFHARDGKDHALRRNQHELMEKDNLVHVCFCTDEKDLRGVATAIRSVQLNAKDPERLRFHLVVKHLPEALMWMRRYFPEGGGVKMDLRSPSEMLEKRIQSLVDQGESSEDNVREALENVYNFAPFYLDVLMDDVHPDQLVYLDTDTLVTGDIAELADMDLGDHPAAAVKDCVQRLHDYINFKVLEPIMATRKSLPPGTNPERMSGGSCVFNRGVFVMNVKRWKELGVVKEIEYWVMKRAQFKKLYWSGVSQPPWLLALKLFGYKTLPIEWNTRGLGRASVSNNEMHRMIDNEGFHPSTMYMKGIDPKKSFINMKTHSAKVMHYNGKFKPWIRPECGTAYCKAEIGQFNLTNAECKKEVYLDKFHILIECSEIWWSYFSTM